MPAEFAPVFAALKTILSQYERYLSVKTDTPVEYTVLTKALSPFPQHQGQPLYFGSVRLGKAYVSFHLMPLYMCPDLIPQISPALKKRMQGKTCFNFKTMPTADLFSDLRQLTEAGVGAWLERKWL
jgi:hypothetical protein